MNEIKKSRRLSIDIQSLLDQLYTQESVEILKQIQESREFAAIPYIRSFLCSHSPEIVTATENVISDLLLHCPVSELIWISERCRENLPFAYQKRAQAWSELKPETVLQWTSDIHPIQIIMASFHHDGYVREAALQRLSQFQNGSEIPWLLIRLNDWVSPIRFKAYRALKQRIHIENVEYFIQLIWLVQRLVGRGKEHHEVLSKDIQQLIVQPEVRDVLHHHVHSEDRYIRYFCYETILNIDQTDVFSLLTQALQDQQLAIRLWATRQVAHILSEQEINTTKTTAIRWLDIVYKMLEDDFPSIRRQALDLLHFHFADQAERSLQQALMSDNSAIRETARRHLSQHHSIAYSEYYLDQIWSKEDKSLTAAIAGLGETGTAEDAEVIAEYKDHDLVKVRKAVFVALSKLDAITYIDLFRKALFDPQPGISKIASHVLKKYTYLVHREPLIQTVLKQSVPHVARNSLRVLIAFDSWESLDSLLYILAKTENRTLQQTIKSLLSSWIVKANNQFRTQLSPDMRKQLLQYIDENTHVLDQQQQRTLKWIITL